MGFFDGVIGGMVGAAAGSLIKHAIDEHGGVQGLIDQFNAKGYGSVVGSWVSNGTNQPITAEQISQVMGSDTVKNFAAKFGIPEDKIAELLAQHLPAAVDQMTPGGTAPAAA
jgi:uncharacterized protein YidB (DUF937 family)